MPDRLPILVVDDDSQMLRTIGDILRFKGYDPIGAGSARESLDVAEGTRGPPAIALVDLKLPDMDGIELVLRLRDIWPLLEVVILTGNATLDSAVRALRQQSYDYLVKPVHPDHLVASVARAGDRWQRRRAELALEESELRLRRMFACVSDAVFITDDGGRIIDANPAAVTLSARSVEKLKGEPIDAILAPVRPSVDVRSSTFAPGLTVHTVRDLSEQRTLEAALRHAQKVEALGRLAGGVAHDFNNLLTVVTTLTSLLLSDRSANDPDRQMLEDIKDAADRGAALTRQLLALGRKQVFTPQVLNLNDTVTGIESILGRLLGDGVKTVVSLDPALPCVFADATQIEQVLLNLAANARDAMPRGGQFSIATKATASHAVIAASDTGKGIPASAMDHLFEPFFTTKAEGQGTGLGLSIVRSIVDQSGGTIRVESELGQGTTFVISLPARGLAATATR